MRTLVSLRLQVFEDYEALSRAAAGIVGGRLRSAPAPVLLLPTGSTPIGMYRRLVDLHRNEGLSFSRAKFFNLGFSVTLGAAKQP
jgi:glucosamine-6-phosphate deaminase